MEKLFQELFRVIQQHSFLRERLPLADTVQDAKDLFIMACYADCFDAVARHGYYGGLTDEITNGFYEFMKGQKL